MAKITDGEGNKRKDLYFLTEINGFTLNIRNKH